MISKTNIIYIVILTFLSIGCTKKDDDSTAIKKKWYSPANGYILKQNGNDFRLYGTTAAGCTQIDGNLESENYAGIGFNFVDNKIIASSELLTGNLVFDELTDDHVLCDFDALLSTQDPQVNFNYLWTIFNDYYAFFDEREVN